MARRVAADVWDELMCAHCRLKWALEHIRPISSVSDPRMPTKASISKIRIARKWSFNSSGSCPSKRFSQSIFLEIFFIPNHAFASVAMPLQTKYGVFAHHLECSCRWSRGFAIWNSSGSA